MTAKIIQDPRGFIKPHPLPIRPQQGLKIQARSGSVYNPCTPSREDVRSANYLRREHQYSSQGYRSASHKPYQGIGDPFFLDQKKMILLTLGQWDQENELSSSSSSDEDEILDRPSTDSQGHNEITTKFVLRRTKTGLNTLDKEVNHGRSLIRNVSLGHDLFGLIRTENKEKARQEATESEKATQSRLSNVQPAEYPSSSDEESDEDLNPEPPSARPISRASYTSDQSGADKFRSMATTLTLATQYNGRRKKKPPPIRPYTPKHNNALKQKEEMSCCQYAVFRQLCSLLWILESMNIDSSSIQMSPICQSWILVENEIGGSRVTGKKVLRDKLAETKWESFTTNIYLRKNSKRPNTRLKQRRSVYPRMSLQSGGGSANSSTTNLAMPPTPSGPNLGVPSSGRHDNSQDESVMSSVQEEEDVTSKGFFKFLDEYYESLKTPQSGEEKEKIDTSREGTILTPTSTKKPREKKSRPHTARSSRSARSARSTGSQRRHGVDEDDDDKAMESLAQTNIHLIRPKSSPGLVAFQSNLPSDKHTETLKELCQSFAKVKEHTALSLHDTLQEMDRNRLKICESKYHAMPTSCSASHKALTLLRARSATMMRAPVRQPRQKTNLQSQWYQDLERCIPAELLSSWYFKLVLFKLQKFALVENATKHTVFKFLTALKCLRSWEICNPDVTAAVEFCRERIVEMTVAEYEEWFREMYPNVERPLVKKKTDRQEHKQLDI